MNVDVEQLEKEAKQKAYEKKVELGHEEIDKKPDTWKKRIEERIDVEQLEKEAKQKSYEKKVELGHEEIDKKPGKIKNLQTMG